MPNLARAEFNGKNSFGLAREHNKSVHASILMGFFPDSFSHIEEYLISLAISGTFTVVKAGEKRI